MLNVCIINGDTAMIWLRSQYVVMLDDSLQYFDLLIRDINSLELRKIASDPTVLACTGKPA